jgi:hypothetical protein
MSSYVENGHEEAAAVQPVGASSERSRRSSRLMRPEDGRKKGLWNSYPSAGVYRGRLQSVPGLWTVGEALSDHQIAEQLGGPSCRACVSTGGPTDREDFAPLFHPVAARACRSW